MDTQKIDLYMAANSDFFPAEQLPFIREKLVALDESKWMTISALQYKNPTTALIISLLIGGLGIDRFYIGDTGKGVGKLLTCGGAGIWTIIDWFNIQSAARKMNFTKLQTYLY